MMPSSNRWTIQRSLFFFIGSSVCFLSLGIGGYLIYSQCKKKKIEDPRFYVRTIIQTGPEKEALKTSYLAELLDLSIDRPLSLYVFDCKEGEKKLLFSPLIKSAKISRMPPNAIYIDYEVRKPVAMLADYKNTAIDWDGYLFPFHPFFSPKEIPEIYLGLPPFASSVDSMGREGGRWLFPIKNPFLTLALDVLKSLEDVAWREHFRLKKIDVSNAFAPSLGQREIVLFTEEEFVSRSHGDEVCSIFSKILRVAPKDFVSQLNNFCVLRRNMEEDYRRQLSNLHGSMRFSPRIIDLRIPQLAFVQSQD